MTSAFSIAFVRRFGGSQAGRTPKPAGDKSPDDLSDIRAGDRSAEVNCDAPRRLLCDKRDERGHFKESDDVGRSLTQDRKRKRKNV